MKKQVLTFIFSIALVIGYSQEANTNHKNVTQLRCRNSESDTSKTNTSSIITWKRTQNTNYSDLLPVNLIIKATELKKNSDPLQEEKKNNK